MSDHAEHPYPSHYQRGTHWAIDEAWEILDALPVGMLPDEYRFVTAGRIAGVLMRRAALPRAALTAASHALKSYAYGNASPDLALSIAAFVDEALAVPASGP